MSGDTPAVTSRGSVVNYVDLTRAALEFVNSPSPVDKLARSIVGWLGREGINESDFQYCVERSRALAYPNDHGLEIRGSIVKSENRVARVGGLHLIASGAIGRWMAFSQDHAYMVTTVAAVTRFQQMNFAAKLLCEMILASGHGSPGEEKNFYSYSVDRARLMGVLSKVVSSITLNVVNAGHTLGELPTELSSLCVHLVDASTFSMIIMKMLRSSGDILLLCDRFQGDLLLWVLAHFEGSIEVSIAGKKTFQRSSVHSQRCFTMIVKTVCQEGPECRKTCHSVELLELLGEKWNRVLDGSDDRTMKVSPSQRQPLYVMQPPEYTRQRDILNREELNQVSILAQRMISWMLEVPLKTNYDSNTIWFETAFSLEQDQVQMHVGDLLYRWPKLLHESFGTSSISRSALVYKAPKSKELAGSDILYDPLTLPLSVLCECFPALSDLVKVIAPRCKCRICRNNGVIDDCKGGCLCHAAMSHLFMLIGNAIADGFGVQDASGVIELDDYVHQVRKVLSDLTEGHVAWDGWFNVAASTALGYSPKGVLGGGYLDEEGNAFVAVQYGSNVVAAKWLDLTQKITANQCFALEMAEGQLSGLQESCVFIQTEVKMRLDDNLEKARPYRSNDSHDVWLRDISECDLSPVKLQHAMIGSLDSYLYRLITVVSSGSSQRIIDPAEALVGVIRSRFVNPIQHNCEHPRDFAWREGADNEDLPEIFYVWSFEDLLGNWDIETHDTFFTKSLDSYLKVNIALSLSANGCILKETPSCLACALEALEVHPSNSRRIISYEISKGALVRR